MLSSINNILAEVWIWRGVLFQQSFATETVTENIQKTKETSKIN